MKVHTSFCSPSGVAFEADGALRTAQEERQAGLDHLEHRRRLREKMSDRLRRIL